jgi:hypothetical protein
MKKYRFKATNSIVGAFERKVVSFSVFDAKMHAKRPDSRSRGVLVIAVVWIILFGNYIRLTKLLNVDIMGIDNIQLTVRILTEY